MSQQYPNSLPYGQGGARVPSALMQKGINFANQLDQDTLIKLIKSATAPTVIAPKVGNTINVDAYALWQLAKILEKKDTSIFDVVLKNASLNEEPDEYYSRITHIFISAPGGVSYIGFIEDDTLKSIAIPYTSTQYEGLAAVQEAGNAQFPDDFDISKLPQLKDIESFLNENSVGAHITDPEGHKISVTAADGKIATLAISEETDPDGIKVPFEDIQKLIGLPISV